MSLLLEHVDDPESCRDFILVIRKRILMQRERL